jgi:HK97 family phage major capsid protein
MLQLNDAEKENRNLSAEEQEKFDKMMPASSRRSSHARSAPDKLYMQDREVEKTLATPIEKRLGDQDAPQTYAEFLEQRNGPRPEDQPEFRSRSGATSAPPTSRARRRGAARPQQGHDDGGRLPVPTSMANEIIRSERDMGAIATLCNEIRTEGGETLNLPANTVHGVGFVDG